MSTEVHSAPKTPGASPPRGGAFALGRPGGEHFLKIEALAKVDPGAKEPVFDQVNFGIQQGEFVCIIGHSGCGKTTILNVLAGLESASSGHVFMDNREVAGPRLERGVVFQGHALMPWLTVRKNIAFAVRSKWPQWSRAQVDEHVEQYVELVGLARAIDKKPQALSGGMKQRVGIARAFMLDPEVVLADEPVASLDPKISRDILTLIRDAARERGTTVLCSLHQIDLAREFGDRIVGMRDGVVVFDGTPAEFTDERLRALYHGAQWDDKPEPAAKPKHNAQAANELQPALA